jgi:hypothetical protein
VVFTVDLVSEILEGLQWSGRGWVFRTNRRVTSDPAVTGEVHREGFLPLFACSEDQDFAKVEGVVPYRDTLADEGGPHLENFSVEADRAVLGYPATCFLKEEFLQVDVPREGSDGFGEPHPAVQGLFAPYAAVGRDMVFSFNPGKEEAVERVEAFQAMQVDPREETPPDGGKPPLQFGPPLGAVGPSVDKVDAQASAEMDDHTAAKNLAVIEIKPPG